MNIQSEASISFDAIFGNASETISLDKIDSFLEKAIQECFHNTKINPNELIRFVDKGKVFWMTAEQAEQYMAGMDEEHKNDIEKKIQESLRGDAKFLSQEIRILLSMAFSTIQQYQKGQMIPDEELNRISQALQRTGRAVLTTLDQLRQVEQNMVSTRQKNPVLDEFEKKMAQFLTLQKKGEKEKAALLAKELVHLKKRYLIVSKVLNNDKNQSHHYRLDTQRHKKTILSNQRYLAAQREGVLQSELQDQRKSIQNIQAVLAKEAGEGRLKYEQLLKTGEENQTKTETELNVVQKERVIFEKKEKETEEVIQKMEVELSESPESAPPAKAEKTPPAKEPERSKTEPVEEEDAKAVKRMARVRQR